MKRKKDIKHSFWKHKHKFLERDIPGKGVKTCVGEAFLQDEIALKIRFVRNNKKNKKNLKKVLTKGTLSCIIRIVVRDTKNFTK